MHVKCTFPQCVKEKKTKEKKRLIKKQSSAFQGFSRMPFLLIYQYTPFTPKISHSEHNTHCNYYYYYSYCLLRLTELDLER